LKGLFKNLQGQYKNRGWERKEKNKKVVDDKPDVH